jgi:hypothetical protein
MRVQQTEHEPPSKVLPWLYSQNLNLALTWFQNTSTWPVIGEEESWDLLPPLGASSFDPQNERNRNLPCLFPA